MTMYRFVWYLAAGSLLLVLAACTITTVSGSWTNENYTGGVASKVLVIGIAKEPSTQRLYEKETVERFREAGVAAVAASDFFPPEEQLAREAIVTLAQRENVSHILVTRALRVEEATETRTYVTGDAYYPANHYHNPTASRSSWYSSYNSDWGAVRTQQTTTTYTYVILNLEMNLYEVASETLAWSTLLEALHDSSEGETIKSINRAAFKQLAKDGLLP